MLPAPERAPEFVDDYIQSNYQELASELTRSVRLWNWYVANLHARGAPNTVRARMAVSMLQVCAEHQSAIASLLNTPWVRAASALALVRPAVEAMLMGVWVLHVATEDQLVRIDSHRATPPTLSDLLRALDRSTFSSEPLYPVFKSSIPALDGFTHGGIWHMESRQDGHRVGANYLINDVVAGLRLADLAMVMASLEMAQLTGDHSLSARMYLDSREFLGLGSAECGNPTGTP